MYDYYTNEDKRAMSMYDYYRSKKVFFDLVILNTEKENFDSGR